MPCTTIAMKLGLSFLLLATADAFSSMRASTPREVPRDLQSSEATFALSQGVPFTLLNHGSKFELYTFVLSGVPAGQRVACAMTGDGNVNIAARYGALPTNLDYDCIGYIAGTSNEGCGLYAAPSDTDVHVTLYAFSAFESLTLTCSFVDLMTIENGVPLTGVNSSLPGSTLFYQVSTNILAGENVSCSLEGENGNANLYLRYGQDPQIFSKDGNGFDCQSRKPFSKENCVLNAPAADTPLFAAIDTMTAFANLTFICSSPIGYEVDLEERGWGCFSGDMSVQVRSKGRILMKDLQVKDEVVSGFGANGQPLFEPVYSFGHFHKTLKMDYLQLYTANSKLELTANHLLYINGKDIPVRADTVKVGDILTGSGSVIRIRKIQGNGAYLPLTPSGKIVVNNALASTYISIRASAPKIVGAFTIGEHTLFHAWLAPYRTVCSHFSSNLCLQNGSTNENEDGILLWLQAGLALAEFGETQHFLLQLLGICLVSLVMVVFAVVEFLLGSWQGLLVVAMFKLARAVVNYRRVASTKRLG